MTARNRALYPLASAIALLSSPLAAQDAPVPAPMTAQDLVTMPRLGSPSADADGTLAIYSVTTTDPKSYKRSSALWLRTLDDVDAAPIKLDLTGSDARFGDGGWVYFLADSATGGDKATTQVSARARCSRWQGE